MDQVESKWDSLSTEEQIKYDRRSILWDSNVDKIKGLREKLADQYQLSVDRILCELDHYYSHWSESTSFTSHKCQTTLILNVLDKYDKLPHDMRKWYRLLSHRLCQLHTQVPVNDSGESPVVTAEKVFQAYQKLVKKYGEENFGDIAREIFD